MTKLMTLVKVIFYLGLVCLGVFIAVAINWTNGSGRWLGVIAFAN
jgi:hypothetical protein